MTQGPIESSGTRVEVVGPYGERGTVDNEEVPGMAQGWRVASPEERHQETAKVRLRDTFGGGGLGDAVGTGLSALYGAGRSVSVGTSDSIIGEGAGLLGGESARKDWLDIANTFRDANPTANTVGEVGGLLAGGLGAAGEKIGAGVAARVGEGLLGDVSSLGARGAFEGGAIGAQQQISEDVLGDHAINGQAVFANGAKDALLGGVAGGALGAAGNLLGRGRGLLAGRSGPTSDAVLNEVSGVDGAGRALQTDARASQELVDNLRRAGATEDQAVRAAGDVQTMSSETAAHGPAGPLTGAVDAAASVYKGARRALGGMNADLEEVMNKGYADRATRIAEQEQRINSSAATLSKRLTSVMRNSEDTLNEAQFTQKPGQFAKLVDTSLANTQRNAVASLLQEADETLKFWEGTAAKGGAEGSIKSLRKTWKDALDSMAKVDNDATPTMSRDLYIKTDNLKRAFDRTLSWGRENRFGMPEAIRGVGPDGAYGLETMANKFRTALEDGETWGQAGPAQARLNGSFSDLKARRDHLVDQLGVAIDQKNGILIREGDFAKTRGLLNQITGGETDGMLQPVKSAEAFIDGMRARDAAAREFLDLSPKQLAKMNQGLADVADFEKELTAARKDAGIVNRLKRQQLQEQAHGIGGALGLIGDMSSKPLATMEKLAGIRHTAQTIEKGVAGGLRRFFGKSGPDVLDSVAPRARAEAIREMTQVRELAGNPQKLEANIAHMTGDLGNYAPKTANEVKNTARRAIFYLAKELPIGIVRGGLLGAYKAEPRYSDQQVSEWESKRRGAFGAPDGTDAPRAIVADMKRGQLNREAIKALEFVSPDLFAQVQELARDQLTEMQQRGELDKMPYQQQAAIASLLKIAPDGTWTPDFINLMQAAKMQPAPQQGPEGGGAAPKLARKAGKPTAPMFATESERIEGKAS